MLEARAGCRTELPGMFLRDCLLQTELGGDRLEDYYGGVTMDAARKHSSQSPPQSAIPGCF